MGSFLTKLYLKVFGRKEMRILILGLENAGKTTFLYKLIFKKQIESVPSNAYLAIGFNIESFTFQNLSLQIWDLGGQKSVRDSWHSYYPNTQGMIYIIDSSDRARLDLTKQELHTLLQHEELKNVPILILANKQDLPDALSASSISSFLDLHSFNNPVQVFPYSHTQDSSESSLIWLVTAMKSNSN